MILRVNETLTFRLLGLADELEDPIRHWLGYFVQTGVKPNSRTIKIRFQYGKFSGSMFDGEPFRIDGFEVRRRGHQVDIGNPGLFVRLELDRSRAEVWIGAVSPAVLDQLIPRLLPTMLSELAQHRGWSVLHAAAVSVDGYGLLMPGTSGVGKSTLFRSAHKRGFGVLSDDLVWLAETEEGFRLHAFPRGFPSKAAPGPTVNEAPLSAIVCPSIASRPENRVSRISAGEALSALVAQSSFLAGNSAGGEGFRRLVRATATALCFRLEAGQDRHDVADCLTTVAGELAKVRAG